MFGSRCALIAKPISFSLIFYRATTVRHCVISNGRDSNTCRVTSIKATGRLTAVVFAIQVNMLADRMIDAYACE